MEKQLARVSQIQSQKNKENLPEERRSVRGALQIFVLLAFGIAGCGKVTDSPLGTSSTTAVIPSDPILESVTYQENGSNKILYGPFIGTQTITPDFPSGSCGLSQASILLQGTFDAARTTTLTLSGVTSQQTLTGSQFSITACVSNGTLALTLTSISSTGNPDAGPPKLSLDIANPQNGLTTVGFGSPNYPSTGFQAISNQPNILAMTSNGLTMENSFVGPYAQIVPSTNSVGYFLFNGFTNYLSQLSP